MFDELKLINDRITELLSNLEQLPAENEKTDELVHLLQVAVRERQVYVERLTNLPFDINLRDKLSEQVELSNRFSLVSAKVMNNRKELLSLRRSTKKKINMYEYVDSNR
ncbi:MULTISPECIES: hypothetical protein [Pseudomonadati]|uniref:Flagella biosynthesis chaperone for FliD, FliT n=1 Tax=Shewanella aestuarii TaxID=1028752 RepID=A0ABT0L202_9GAMM|nr:hypothetical protein [Shewanella aestuarii]MCL1117762.1 hypothetical protein [Shewanella aestuarii]GGN76875.1 hypothetical protein GCM10009193_18570 [Shewanella aestuarii]